MPWSMSDFPAALKNLPENVRKKAIEIANALLEKGMEDGSALAIAITNAKKFVKKHPSYACVGSARVKLSTVSYLEQEDCNAIAETLNMILKHYLRFGLALKNSHWNTKGMSFAGLHPLYDSAYEHAVEATDLIAERAVQLGHPAQGSPDHICAFAIEPFGGSEIGFSETGNLRFIVEKANQMSVLLHAALEAMVDYDNTTADVLIEISRQLDKDLWQIQAHLEG